MNSPGDPPPIRDERHGLAPLWLYALAFAALAVAGWLFGAMAEAARREIPGDLDTRIPDWVRAHAGQWPLLTRIFRAATRLGDFPISVILVLLVAGALMALHRAKIGGVRRADPFLWLGVTSTGWLLNVLLKLWFERPRPPEVLRRIAVEGFSFPSGHAAFAGVFFGLLALLIARPTPRRPAWLRAAGVLLCLVLAVLIAASRVWLHAHYPTDVIGGLLVGAGWAIAAWLVRSGWARWRLRHGPTPRLSKT
jgi:membrane-associated phospholipid phosphatase